MQIRVVRVLASLLTAGTVLAAAGLAASPAVAAPKSPSGKGANKPAPTASPTPSPTATATPPPPSGAIGPRSYVLALGDSIAQGSSPTGIVTDAYPYTYAAGLVGTTLVDYACAGESSRTFVDGGCPYPMSVAHPYTGAQLQAAVDFIAAHPGQVSPVTVQLGANDLFAVTGGGCGVATTAPAALDAFEADLRRSATALRSALAGTGDLVLMGIYHPYQNDCAARPESRAVFIELNARTQLVSQELGARFVDVFVAFGNDQPAPNAFVCTYTFMCESRQDVHPKKAGHDAIARALRATLGY